MELNNLLVIEDTREQEPFNFRGFPFDVERRGLKYGDYSISGCEDKFVIERKRNTGELSKNIVEARFERELEQLNTYERAFIVCEFPLSYLDTFPACSGIPQSKWRFLRIKAKFLRKRVHELQEKYPNIEWVFCDDKFSATYTSARLICEYKQVK